MKDYPEKRQSGQSAMILPEHGFIWLSSAKVCSQSILFCIMTSLGRRCDRGQKMKNTPQTLWHFPHDIPSKYKLLPKIGLIREPVTRTIAAYAYRLNQCKAKPTQFKNAKTLADCLGICVANTDPYLDDHFKSQAYSVRNADFLGSFDQKEEWWEEVRGMSKIPLPEFPHRNPTLVDKPEPTSAQVADILTRYAEDRELWESVQ